MKKSYTLYLDESGYSDPKTFKGSPVFVVSGCIVNKKNVEELRENVNQIKFANWREDWKKVSFRSMDIGLSKGPFFALYDTNPVDKVRKPNEKMIIFCRDLKNLFKKSYFELVSCVLDKEKAFVEKNVVLEQSNKKMKYIWSQENVYHLTYRHILRSFVYLLVIRDAVGKICVEASSDQQDIIIYKEFFSLQANGIPELDISHEEVKERLSSLNFVTKHNGDIEEQLADLMGYANKLKFLLDKKLKKESDLNQYDKMILKALKSRSLNISANLSIPRLKRISKELKPRVIIP